MGFSPRCRQVGAKMASTSPIWWLRQVLFPQEIFRAITAGPNERFARLLVGSAPSSYRQPNSNSKSCCLYERFPIRASPGPSTTSSSKRLLHALKRRR